MAINIENSVLKDLFICKTYRHAPIFGINFVSPLALRERYSSQLGSPTEYYIVRQVFFWSEMQLYGRLAYRKEI